MAVAINGSGTITGISAGGLPDDCITTADIAANAVTYAKIGTTEQGQLCKAWVNFNGTGTVAIRASYNVSSITDNGVGNYTMNFATALADANYVPVALCGNAPGVGPAYATAQSQSTDLVATSSSFRFGTGSAHATGAAMTNADPTFVQVAVFR